MISLKTNEEIQKLKELGRIHAQILGKLAKAVKPGITTKSLDDMAVELFNAHGVVSAFKGYKPYGTTRPFPASICVSINDEVVHGIPGERILKQGDVVKLDLGIQKDGLFTDMATTVTAGKASEDVYRLLEANKMALQEAVDALTGATSLKVVGKAVMQTARKFKVTVLRELCGHGVGHDVHEEPLVLNFESRDGDVFIEVGMVLALEPILTLGSEGLELASDGWTLKTHDGEVASHEEVTLAVTENGIEVLTV